MKLLKITASEVSAMSHFDALAELGATLQSLDGEAASRLRPGLTREAMQARCKGFSWSLPEEVAALYAWHDGLAQDAGRFTILERLLRQKDKWHGELSGRENEVRFLYSGQPMAAKFMPLEFALAGHRHLKLLNCQLDLLPVFILQCDFAKWYGMFRLGAGSTALHCVNGKRVAPRKVTEELLAANLTFPTLADFVSFLTRCGQRLIVPGELTQPLLQSALGAVFSAEKIAAVQSSFEVQR